jgi:hypothetical protein
MFNLDYGVGVDMNSPKHWTGKAIKLIRKPNGCLELSHNKLHVHGYQVAYILDKGDIPEGLILRHTCDNRKCINTQHIITGTHKENSQDMVRRGRHKSQKRTHCPKGHLLDGTRKWNNQRNSYARYCKTCNRLNVAKWNERRRSKCCN